MREVVVVLEGDDEDATYALKAIVKAGGVIVQARIGSQTVNVEHLAHMPASVVEVVAPNTAVDVDSYRLPTVVEPAPPPPQPTPKPKAPAKPAAKKAPAKKKAK